MKVITIFALGLAIAIVCELFHRYRRLAWFVMAGLPVLLTPLWIRYPHNPFIWAKLYSIILIGMVLLTYATPRFSRSGRYYLIVLAFICLNIMEAVVQNLFTGVGISSWPNLMNALAGVLIIAALPYKNFMSVASDGGRTLVHCDLHFGIVACYTIWNTCFVYLEWPSFIGLQIMLMLVPLAFMAIDRKLWVETRVYSLALYLMVHFTRPSFIEGLELAYTPSVTLGWIMAGVSLIASLVLVIRNNLPFET